MLLVELYRLEIPARTKHSYVSKWLSDPSSKQVAPSYLEFASYLWNNDMSSTLKVFKICAQLVKDPDCFDDLLTTDNDYNIHHPLVDIHYYYKEDKYDIAVEASKNYIFRTLDSDVQVDFNYLLEFFEKPIVVSLLGLTLEKGRTIQLPTSLIEKHLPDKKKWPVIQKQLGTKLKLIHRYIHP
jgi:hypothetical protein